MLAINCVLIVVVLIHCQFASALNFNLAPGEEVCLSEDVFQGSMFVVDFAVTEPAGSRLPITVTDPAGNLVYNRLDADTGKFAHTATKMGEYRTCFFNNEAQYVKSVQAIIKSGTNARDWEGVARRDNLKPLEVELKRMEDVIDSVHSDLIYLSEREAELRTVNDTMANRLTVASAISLVALIVIAGAQVLYLRNFFQSKRLI